MQWKQKSVRGYIGDNTHGEISAHSMKHFIANQSCVFDILMVKAIDVTKQRYNALVFDNYANTECEYQYRARELL